MTGARRLSRRWLAPDRVRSYAGHVAPGESEKETRRTRIDGELDALGWKEAKLGSEPAQGPYRIPEIETDEGPADYGLYIVRKLVGIVEAKKVGLSTQNVLTQAERYAKGVKDGPYKANGYGVPFIYSSNGEVIWQRRLSPTDLLVLAFPWCLGISCSKRHRAGRSAGDR